VKESDIRPQELMQRYIELSAKDAEHCFDGGERRDIPCIACGSKNVEEEFTKNSFAYALCRECGTLYQTPRPSIEQFEVFYRDSESSRYWAEVFFPTVAEARREKIFKPRVEHLAEICKEVGLEVEKLIDVGAGYGIFLDEWRTIKPETELLAVEPSSALVEECRNKGFNVIESTVENVTGYDSYADLVVCFEVLEHVDDPLEFITVLKKMVRPGGYLFVSTLCIDGFDLKMLWDKSSQISPPHHINFHSIKGFELLFARAGLHEIQITTPGKLDVDIVKNFVENNPDIVNNNKFMKDLLYDRGKSKLFQEFLADNQLSSHAWVLGKKLEDE
jgi:2-polyprenyl-3-methyl-5-hydroxy-6-metoxy-1,4-benzoquinol methylase